MRGDFGNVQSGREGRRDHLHLDRRMARAEVQPAEDIRPNRAETVLGVGQARAVLPVDHISNKGGPRETQKFITAAVQFIRAAEEPGAGHMFREAGLDRRSQHRDIHGIVRAVGIDKHADGRGDVIHPQTQRRTFAQTLVAHHDRAGLGRDGRRAVGRAAFDDNDLRHIVETFAHDQAHRELLVARGDNDRDVRVGLVFRTREVIRLRASLPEQTARATNDEQPFAFTKPD